MRDSAGNISEAYTTAPTSSGSVTIDANAPFILSVEIPDPGTYIAGQVLKFDIIFNEKIIIRCFDINKGYKRFPLTIGSRSLTTEFSNYSAFEQEFYFTSIMIN